MSRTVTLELSDEDYARIEQEADATGRTPTEVIAATLHRHASLLAWVAPPASDEATPQVSGPITASEVEQAFRISAERIAARTGQPPEEIIAETKAKIRAVMRPPLSEEERLAARKRMEAFFGVFDSGDPHSADNERIDADLAREYGRGLDWDK
jgi:hypothetical protein